MIQLLIALLILLPSGFVAADDGSGLKLGVNADIVGQAGLVESSSASGKLEVREAEVVAYGPIDHLFDGVLSIAAHQEDEGANMEIHEAYFGSTKLIPRSRFKVGQFFLGVGRLQQYHRHDWPFISPPKYHPLFFAEEAALDSGLEYSYLTPLPFYLDITAGITSGFVFGHAHNQGTKPTVPTHYLRLATYQTLGTSSGIQVGLNYLGRKNSDHDGLRLLGLDVVAKYKDADGWKYLLQSELWYKLLDREGQDLQKEWGMYVFPNVPLMENFWAGVRFDYYTQPSLSGPGGAVSNGEYAIVPTLTYRSSEFATFKLAAHLSDNRQDGESLSKDRLIEAQAVFILGAHPAHEF